MQDRTMGLPVATPDLQTRVTIALVAGLLGAFILLGAGLLQADVLHNAAHDARHAFAFPCH